MKQCFLFGHHQATEAVGILLRDELHRHIREYGISCFVVGHYGAFDRIAAKQLSFVKAQMPSIRLYLLCPYHPTERPVSLPPLFDGSLYPPSMESVPPRFAILRANRYMLSQCDYAIGCVQNTHGNAAALATYAQSLRHLTLTLIP